MSSPFTPIVGTLAYVLDRSRGRVLMVRRDRRPDDAHLGKLNGLGGKVEVDESIAAGLRRELWEEARLTDVHLDLRGTITWSNFGPRREQWLGFVFLVERWQGHPPPHNDEGTLEWVELERLLRACDDDESVRISADLPMWAGDRFFVPLVFDDGPQFHGTMPYDGDRPLAWHVERPA